jgi:hypothetical protein
MKARAILLGLILQPLICVLAVPACAQTSNADFQQAVAAYQQSPSDASAEEVIRMAATMNQLPPIPEEARRHFVRGTALFKDAKSPDEFKQVVDEFRQAARIAPWWPDARYNFALAWEAAGDYDKAIVNVKLYLLFKLPDSDARTAQDKIYALEAKQEKAAKAKEEENSPQAVAAREQQSFQDLLKKMDGRRYIVDTDTSIGIIDIKGKYFVFGDIGKPGWQLHQGYKETERIEIEGRVTSRSEALSSHNGPVSHEETYSISDDGDTIAIHTRNSGGVNTQHDTVYHWQR